jgi:hypothetical protein
MKTFKNFLNENSGLSSEHAPYDLSDESVKAKINAILGHTASSEYMTVEAAVNQMDAKLNQLGLFKETMDEDVDFTTSGNHSVSYKRMDAFGKSVDTPFDEFETNAEGYTLSLKVEKLETGSFKVYGSLV